MDNSFDVKLDQKLNELKTKLMELYDITGDLNFPDELFDEFNYLVKKDLYSRYTKNHDTVHVYNPFYREYIKIDIDIAALIKRIWTRGWKTVNSCQDNIPKGYVWIEFVNSSHLQEFLNTIFQKTPDNLDVSMRAFSYDYLPNAWIYNILPFPNVQEDSSDKDQNKDSDKDSNEDQNIDSDEDDFNNDISHVTVTVSIRFPISDLDFVYQRLKSN
jgi:hypothetical protein